LADFEIKDLRASVEGRQILKGVSLAIDKGEVHAVMGPNGSGKSTLSHTLMGHPGYTVDGGSVIFKGQNVLELEPDERARLGMFLALQYPVVVPGISMANFLRTAINAHRGQGGPQRLAPPDDAPQGGSPPSKQGGAQRLAPPDDAPQGGSPPSKQDGKDKSKMITPKEFRSLLKSELEVLHMDDSFVTRYSNDGLSGGGKKRAEIL